MLNGLQRFSTSVQLSNCHQRKACNCVEFRHACAQHKRAFNVQTQQKVHVRLLRSQLACQAAETAEANRTEESEVFSTNDGVIDEVDDDEAEVS